CKNSHILHVVLRPLAFYKAQSAILCGHVPRMHRMHRIVSRETDRRALPVTTTSALPRWDMTVVYPGLDSAEFDQGFRAVADEIAGLSTLFNELHIEQQPAAPLTPELVRVVETIIERTNTVLADVQTLSAYISAFVTTDSRDDIAQGKFSELQQHTVRLSQLTTRLVAWIGSLDVEALIAESAVAREHAFALRQAKIRAAHQMTPPEEALAAELNVTGGSAWGKLHGNVTSQLTVPIELEGEVRELPMSAVRNLAYEEDQDVRRRAYEAEPRGWERGGGSPGAAANS